MPKSSSPFQISKSILEKFQDKKWLKNQLVAGKRVQELIGFSDETMDQFYTKACHLFENKNYSDSSNAFLFLVTVNPYHYDYWLGLGAATQHCNQYEAAIDAYEMAAICQLDNPIPYFHLANCLFAMHDRDSALQALDLVLEYSQDIDAYDDIRRKAISAKTVLAHEEEG